MSKKILFIENVASIKAISFYIAAAIAAQQCGFEFHVAYNASDRTQEDVDELKTKYNVVFHQIDFIRLPYDPRNLKAYRQVCRLINDEHFDLIHCNTPIGGVIGRLAGKKCKVERVLYEAHGFHFYDGAPKKNWLIYYPIEKWLARKTDAIITINKEDFERATCRFKLRNHGKVYYVPGVGIDLSQYKLDESTRAIKRTGLGLKDTDIFLISIGELNKNKNNKVVIEALANLNNRNLHYFLCGVGTEENELRKMAKERNICNQVHFLGYRTDVKELLKAADIFVMPSIREGLSRSLMEAMASGSVCVVSKIRGNTDLVAGTEFGYLCTSTEDYVDAIRSIIYSDNIESKKNACLERIKMFDMESVCEAIRRIYVEELEG